jgi:type IV fimbrial biogenesis protein FimT
MRQDKASMDAAARTRGVTLVELLMALTVFAILCALAAPTMQRLAARTRITTTQNDLVAALNQARLEAIDKDHSVMVCPSTDDSSCATGRHWDTGWLVADDRNRDGIPDDTPSSTGHAPGNIRIIASAGRHHVRFHPDGSAAGSNLTLVVCIAGRADAGGSSVVVSNVGRIRLGHPDAAAVTACAGSS